MRIPVVDVDEFRAALVRAGRDGACELFLPEARADVEDLALLHVGAEVDEQVGEAFDAGGHGQAMLTGPRMALHADHSGDRAFPQLARAGRGDPAFLSPRRGGVRTLAGTAEPQRPWRGYASAHGLRRRARAGAS